jgi:hypothetical protein
MITFRERNVDIGRKMHVYWSYQLSYFFLFVLEPTNLAADEEEILEQKQIRLKG